jgi:tetratricopeptide (TPR) repeat protein
MQLRAISKSPCLRFERPLRALKTLATPTIHSQFLEIGFVPSISRSPMPPPPFSGAADCTGVRVRDKLGDNARSESVLPALLLLFAASTSFDDSFRAGLLALQRGDLASAQANLEAAGKLAPRDGRVWVALSQTYWRLHNNAAAEDAAGKAATLAPEDPAVLQGLAIYYSETNQTLKAAQAAAKYSAKVPENGDARERAAGLYFDAARPLLDQQKFTEAVVILKEGAARLPNNAQLELALGVADYGLRRFDDAADAFLRTIEIAPETEQPYTFLGRILDQIPWIRFRTVCRRSPSGSPNTKPRIPPAPPRICSTPKLWTRSRWNRRRRCACFRNL